MMTKHAIEARGLKKLYRGTGGAEPKLALKGIDLTVPVGSIFGLLGPNGAGKSTFINILAGLVTKSAGEVKIWGFDQDVNPRMSRASIGVVPQELHIDPFLTPLEQLEVQAGLYGVPKKERPSAQLLEAMGLSDKAGVYARTLSGGMQRRLLVCKAMVHSPPVLVLDEPTAGVDIELRKQLWDYVKELNARGVTIILTTHYLEEAEEMCDHIAIINHGEVAVSAPKAELLSTIDAKSAVIRSTAPITQLEALRAHMPEGVTLSLTQAGEARVDFAKRAASLGAIIAGFQRANVEISDLSTIEPDLEDVFLELTSAKRREPEATA